MIKVAGLSLDLGGRTLYNGLSFDVQKGEKILLTGDSGTGKSTLLKCLMGFVEGVQGQIEIKGLTLVPDTYRASRQHMAYVSQDVDFRDLAIRDFLTRLDKLGVTYQPAEFWSYLDQLQVPINQGKKTIGRLSGGERQRLGLALALSLDRPILLLDEVTSGLDPRRKDQVIDLVIQDPRTALVVSHDPAWQGQGLREVALG